MYIDSLHSLSTTFQFDDLDGPCSGSGGAVGCVRAVSAVDPVGDGVKRTKLDSQIALISLEFNIFLIDFF